MTGASSHSFRNDDVAGRRRRQHHVLGVLDQAVVLGVEDVVDGGQADVLVDAAVAGDVVRVEQLVVVGAGRRRRRSPMTVIGVGAASGVAVWLSTGSA